MEQRKVELFIGSRKCLFLQHFCANFGDLLPPEHSLGACWDGCYLSRNWSTRTESAAMAKIGRPPKNPDEVYRPVMVRLPAAMATFIADEAVRNNSSRSLEVARAVAERMQREAAQRGS